MFAVLLSLLCHKLIHLFVRDRHWQYLGRQSGDCKWLPSAWFLWMPMALIVSTGPWGNGPLIGTIAGEHAYWGLSEPGVCR